MIVHEQCSSNGTSTTASHSKICGVCGSPSDVGSQIVFQTICSECAKLKPHGALIARNEPPEFDDFCIDCKRIIPSSNKSPSHNRVPKVTEEETEPKEPSVTLKKMVKDLSRILNGVTKIKRNTLLKRLIKECDYSKKDASMSATPEPHFMATSS